MNPQNGQTPLDYLNQIAPQAPKRAPFTLNLKTILFFGGIAVVLVIILGIIVSSLSGGRKETWQQLSGRLATTQTIAEDATQKLKSSQLRSLNSDLKIYLTNTQRDATEPLKSLGINPEKLPGNVTKAESATEMIERLEDARLNAKFDSTYSREMSYQLATILSLYQQLYASSNKAEDKAFLDEAYKNLLPTQEALADFSSSKE